MTLKIDWNDPLLQEGAIQQIQPHDLDDFYATALDEDKSNLFFILLNSFHHYLQAENRQIAAHLSFLLAYYLFVPLTPPGSNTLALHYIRQAIALNPLEEYRQWLLLMENGN